MDPVLYRGRLLRVEQQARFQRALGELVALVVLVHAADVVQRHRRQRGIGVLVQVALCGQRAPGLQREVDMTRALMREAEIDHGLAKAGAGVQASLVSSNRAVQVALGLQQRAQVEQREVAQRMVRAIDPAVIEGDGIRGASCCAQLVRSREQLLERHRLVERRPGACRRLAGSAGLARLALPYLDR